MKTEKIPYQRQIFVCTNDREGERASCGDDQGEDVFRKLREIAKTRKLHPKIRVAQAKCLGQCRNGVNIMIYPDDIWHSEVTVDDIEWLANEYIAE